MDTFVIILKFYSLIKIFNYNSTIFIIWSLNLFLWSLYGTSWSLKLYHMVTNLIIYFIKIWSLILCILSHYGTLWTQYEQYGHLFNIKKKIRTTIATHHSELDCQYLRGKFSIVQNLPRPAVIEIDDHSYCSVKQCIAYFLGKGYLPAMQLPNNAKQSEYIRQRAKNLYGNDLENILIMTGVQWSDDFEPNSLSKSLRGGVWIKTITFLSNNSESNSIRDTYPISIGAKHICHDVIEKNI